MTRLRVLLVPDSLAWITGTIAREIAARVPDIDARIVSGPVLRRLLARGRNVGPVDLVHYLTPQEALLTPDPYGRSVARVLTVHHLDEAVPFDPARDTSAWDAIMTVCVQWHEALIAHGVEPSALVRVPVGVDAVAFRPPSADERRLARARLRIPPGGFVVGFCAKRPRRNPGRKDVDLLAATLERSSVPIPQLVALIVGPGWKELVEALRRTGVTCRWQPYREGAAGTAEAYRAMDAFFVAARTEGGPVPLLEAMSSGLPVVTTPVGVAPELVQDGENGVVVPFGGVVQATEALTRLHGSPPLRDRLGSAARRRVVAERSWEATADAAARLYHTAMARFHGRGGEQEAAAAHALAPRPPSAAWLHTFEEIATMQGLLRLGARGPAAVRALRALAQRPADPAVWLALSGFVPGVDALRRALRTLGEASGD